MVQFNPIAGHTRTVRRVQIYLEGKDCSRPLAHDFFNLSPFDDERQLTWSQQMDRTRELFGNNEPAANGRLRSFEHFVISPDPADRVDLATLRQLTCDWVQRFFSDYEVAVVYHDDNDNHIPHAHVVVNNTNLVDGHRLSSDLTNDRIEQIQKGLQAMATEYGLRAFSSDHKSKTPEELAEEARAKKDEARAGFGSTPRVPKPATASQAAPRRPDKAQAGIDARGAVSWKSELQDLVDLARMTSRSEEQFLSSLRAMGVEVTRSAKGDYLYHHPMGGAKRVTGRRLGRAYERRSVMRGFALGYADFVQRARRSPLSRVAGVYLTDAQIDLVCSTVHATTPGRVPGSVTAKDLARLVTYNAQHKIKSAADYGTGREAARMRALADKVGIFDEAGIERRTRMLRADVRLVGAWLQETRSEAGAGGGAFAEPSQGAGESRRREEGGIESGGGERSRRRPEPEQE